MEYRTWPKNQLSDMQMPNATARRQLFLGAAADGWDHCCLCCTIE